MSTTRTASLKDYIFMTKPAVALLVAVTVIPGMLLASPSFPNPVQVLMVLFGTALAAASGAVFNQMIDFNIDKHMNRTNKRPIPEGKMTYSTAAIYGFLLSAIGLGLVYYYATPLAAALTFAGNAFYIFIYSLFLKNRTSQNIVIGGAAGAVGPLIGWAAVTGNLGFTSWILFLVIFLWTPPHFWALALKYKDDYASAKVPMLPVVKGDEVTRKSILFYTFTLIPPVVVLHMNGSVGMVCFLFLIALSLVFIYKAFKLYRHHNNDHAMAVFHYSCLYLFVFFSAVSLDRVIALIL
jgi:protoheme IX farnesyltransferase